MMKSSSYFVALKRAGGWCKPVCRNGEWTSEPPNRTLLRQAVDFGAYVLALQKTGNKRINALVAGKVSCFSANEGGTTGSSSFGWGPFLCFFGLQGCGSMEV